MYCCVDNASARLWKWSKAYQEQLCAAATPKSKDYACENRLTSRPSLKSINELVSRFGIIVCVFCWHSGRSLNIQSSLSSNVFCSGGFSSLFLIALCAVCMAAWVLLIFSVWSTWAVISVELLSLFSP